VQAVGIVPAIDGDAHWASRAASRTIVGTIEAGSQYYSGFMRAKRMAPQVGLEPTTLRLTVGLGKIQVPDLPLLTGEQFWSLPFLNGLRATPNKDRYGPAVTKSWAQFLGVGAP